MSATLHQPPGKPTQAHSTLRPLGKRLLTIIAITAISFSPAGQAQSPHPFVASEFEVPETLETEKFRLRMLTVNDVVKDFEAVTTSKEHLHDIWGPGWPDGLTLEQNLIDLGWHQKEFQRRRSFAYTVVAPDESRVLTELRDSVKAWIAAKWPFGHPVFPGTDLSWEEWEKLEEVKR
jgi:hypothetical protein